MGLIGEIAIVKWGTKNRKYYENLNYKFTNYGDEFEVEMKHLSKGSNATIEYFCDECGVIKSLMYKDYIKLKKENNKMRCNKCVNRKNPKNRKIKTNHKPKIVKTFFDWAVENNRYDVLLSWDYELNKTTPEEVGYLSKKKYWFRCLLHKEHKSELKIISPITRGKVVKCNQCNSMAQYILDNFPNKELCQVWDYKKNGTLNPWEVSKGSKVVVWIKCQKKEYHGSYSVKCNDFSSGQRCGYCYGRKLHIKDTIGQYIVDNYGEDFLKEVWSDKNDKSPFEYFIGSHKKVWWNDSEGEGFLRKVCNTILYGFENPKKKKRIKYDSTIPLTKEQIKKGFDIKCSYREFSKNNIVKSFGYYKDNCTGIYEIVNTINGKKYIGQAKNIEDRWVGHINSTMNENAKNYDYPLYRAIRKYGLGNFDFKILEECDVSSLDDREVYYIEKFNPYIHNKNSHGYNQTKGGCCYALGEEVKKKLSLAMKEKCKQGVFNYRKKEVMCENNIFKGIEECSKFYGVKYTTMANWLNHSNDMPKKWYDKGLRYKDEPMENYKLSQVEIRKVVCEDITYDNITDCAKHYNVKARLLSQYLNKTNNMPEIWYDRGLRFENETMDDYKISTKGKKVICEGKVFNSVGECARFYNINPSTMRCWLRGRNPIPEEFKNKELKYYKGDGIIEY